jgi:hypothetical protein
LRRPTLKPTDFRTDARLVQALLVQAGDEMSGSADSRSAARAVCSIFLSDIHLGTRACQAQRLLSFLRHYESQHL